MRINSKIQRTELLLKALLTLVPIMLGLAFFAGVMHDWYYFEFWAIDKELFPRSIEQYITVGVIALFTGIANNFIPIFNLICIIVFLLIMAFFSLHFLHKEAGITHIIKICEQAWAKLCKSKYSLNKNSITNLRLLTFVPVFILSIIFLLLLLTATVVLVAGNIGKTTAQSQYEKLTSGDGDGLFSRSVNIQYQNGHEYQKAEVRKVIFCSEARCAFLLLNGVEIVDRNLIAIQLMKKKAKNTSAENN